MSLRAIIGGGLLAVVAAGGCGREAPAASPATQSGAQAVTVYFSPEDDLSALVVERLGRAHATIHVQAYALSSLPIADALIAAQRRGIDVRVVLDAGRADDPDSQARRLALGGVATFADTRESKAHSKIILVDRRAIITGSYNFAEPPDKATADNLLIIEGDASLMKAYQENFARHLEHARRIKAK